jgi:two-component system nitrate/nitrite response regulator NarL
MARGAVLIVDDHDLIGLSLQVLLRSRGVEAVRSGVDEKSVLETACQRKPGLALVDLDLGPRPDGERYRGAELIPGLRDAGWPVLVFTGTADGHRTALADAIAAGALGWLSKSLPADEVVRRILAAMNGKVMISAEERRELLEERRGAQLRDHATRELLDRLTAREQLVLDRLIAGRRASAIAREFSVSMSTVRTQIHAILAKLDVRSQLEAVALVRALRADQQDG